MLSAKLTLPSPCPAGGRQSKYAINAFEVFDTETRSWTKFPNIPNKRAFSSFVPTEDKLFSLGGLRQGRLYRQPKFMRTVDMFDMEQGGGCPISILSEGALWMAHNGALLSLQAIERSSAGFCHLLALSWCFEPSIRAAEESPTILGILVWQ